MKRSVLALVCMVLVFGLVPGLVMAQEPARKGPTMELAEASYDFGKVKAGTKLQHVFEVKNIGDDVLMIQKVQPT